MIESDTMSKKSSNAGALRTDVVVVGAGGSGLAAAVTAAERGKKVIVLEKRKVRGGISALAEGLFAADSPVAKRQRFFVDKDEVFWQMMDYSQWSLNARLVRTWINKTGNTIAWFEEMGVKFGNIFPWFGREIHPAYHAPEGKGAALIKALMKRGKELGVEVMLKTPAKKILTDGKGRVTGVLATSDGKDVKITAKAVVIATGGFAGNKEMMKKYYADYSDNLYLMGLPHMGDGIRMAEEVGASKEGIGGVLQHGPAVAYDYPKYGLIWIACCEPTVIWVNKYGERYTNEYGAVPPAETLAASNRQPDKVSFSLFDEKMKQRWVTEGLIEGGAITVMPATPLPDFDEMLAKLSNEWGVVKIAPTWDEIAQWTGATPEALKNTIDQYNRSCDHGYDELFIKDHRYLEPLRTPPYYAVKLVPTILNTIGGIKINYRMEVIDNNYHVIPGLYAAGVDTSGWSHQPYNMRFPGNALSYAINSGRMAGESAAECASAQSPPAGR